MSSEHDFLRLFEELRLTPDCSLDELRQAYRRKVREWHPDRNPTLAFDGDNADRLQRLTASYGQVIEFQRRFGRLPGAVVARGESKVATPRSGFATTGRRQHSGFAWLAALAIGVASAIYFLGDMARLDSEAVTPEPAAKADPSATLGEPRPSAQIELGIGQAEVRAIQGEPMSASYTRWEYGPSFVEFEHGRVTGWYSSPMHPLYTAGERPRAAAVRRVHR